MSRIDQEIRALEMRLGMNKKAECGCDEGDELDQEIMALEEDIEGCDMRSAAHKSKSEVVEDVDQELADLYNEINAEDESIISEGAEGETGFFPGGETQNVISRKPTPEAANMLKRRRAAEGDTIDNSEEPHGRGGLWQDKDVVEMELGVDDLADGDPIEVVEDSTEFTDGEFIYAKRLHEASQRLDRVASAIESRGGNWKKLAYRLDRIADQVDAEKASTMKKLAAARVAARKSKKA
jgi:hypothetical protein